MNTTDKSSIQRLDLNGWKEGEVSSYYAARVPMTGLKTALNTLVEQNGTFASRGSFSADGIEDLPYSLLGNMKVYKTADGGENLICMLDNGTNGIIYILNNTAWVAHNEFTFDRAYQVCFVQSGTDIIIFNGKDAFSYYDTVSSTVKRFAAVDDPTSALTAVKSGLSGTSFTIYYKYSYTGNGGETALSPVYSAQISALRENWTSADYFTITRPASTDPDAADWNLFMVVVPNGSGIPNWDDYECIKENIPIATTVIVDNGKLIANTVRTAPENNTTAGVIASYGEIINGRIWALDGHTVHYGGDTDYEKTFGGSHGSGYFILDKDGKEMPKSIQIGRDNSGTTCINVLMSGLAGQGGIYDVYSNSITIGGEQIPVWEPKRREGNDGTNAPFSVLHANNNLYYLSLEGFKSTGVKPNIVGIQTTDIISNAISDRFKLLSQDSLKYCYSAYFDEKILWTVAYGSSTNNQIWVYDIAHGGIWTRWDIESEALFRWTKSSSVSTGLYIVKDKRLLRYSPNSISNNDDGAIIEARGDSGVIRFKEDAREWVYLIHVIFVLLQPCGTINFSVTAHTKKGDVIKSNKISLGSSNIDYNSISATGFTGSHNLKLHNSVNGDFVVQRKEWIDVVLKVKKLTQYFTYSIWTEDKNSSFMLSQVVPEFTDVGVGVDMLTRSDTIKI